MRGVWSDTQTDDSDVSCIHTMFEAQVERTPDAVAVVFENKQLTYRQLNQRANQLAHHLRDLGVGPELLVGICLERSLSMVVGLLGILKAGGAYVPIDPAYPKERLAFILSDTQASVMLTQEQLLESLPAHGAQVVCLDSDWEVIAQNSLENPVCGATASNLVYAIYTSGSTGQPKGVMISHRGICNQLCWRQATFPLTEVDRVLQTISFSFDPSVWQIFWPLSFGAQLFMARPGGHKDSTYLVNLIGTQQITVIALVPSMLRLLLEEKGLDACKSLRHVTCGGEALPVELIENFFARLNLDNVLHNAYGPTEASIDATFWTCKRGTDHLFAPIGRPIANTQIHILDSENQPVVVGVPGEVHIGGIGLARGYLNRPDVTAEKFIPNPNSSEPGARLYKTGDLARYLPDGNIEFIGRIDHQVKLRGFRIELEEIEVALSSTPGVRQSVVMAREDIPGDKRLVAYVVLKQEQAPTIDELRRLLVQKLPDYMVPSAFIVLDALPLTPNGKVDRLTLPPPDQKRTAPEKAVVPPQDPLELELTKIWSKVLGIQPIGVRDNFFELGGHSLLAGRLFAQIGEVFGKNLPMATLFEAPTVEQQASLLQSEWSTPWSSLVAIQPNGSKPPLFCVHALWGDVWYYYDLACYLGPDQPFYGLQGQGLDGKQAPHTRIEDMAADYIREIRTLQPQGPYYIGGWCVGGQVAFEIAQQLHAQGEKVAMLALFDAWGPKYFKPLPFHIVASRHLRKLLGLELKQKLSSFKEWLDYKFYSHNRPKSPLQSAAHVQPVKQAVHEVHEQAVKRAVQDYVPQVYSGRAILFRTTYQPDDAQLRGIDSQFGWGSLLAGGLEIHEVPGNHDSMWSQPNVQVLAEKLNACLDNSKIQFNMSSKSLLVL